MKRPLGVMVLMCGLGLALGGRPSAAADWPQWMGPERASEWQESGIVDSIPKAGLPIVWRAEVGLGYSGPAVADGRLYVMDYVKASGKIANNPGNRDELTGRERTLCLDAATGEVIWEHSVPRAYDVSYGGGPRCTPTVDGDRVYSLGAMGHLDCLSTKDGSVLWSKSFTEDYDAKVPIWGFAGHPLVHGDHLVCLVGGPGSVAVAFDKRTGKEVWKALSSREPGYCPPTLIEQGGNDVLLIWHPEALNALDPASGEIHWSIPLKPSYGMSITAPRKFGNLLYVSAIGNVAAAIELNGDGTKAEVVWEGTPRTGVFCSNSTPFITGGTVYGCDVESSQLMAVDLESGERLWKTYEATGAERGVRHGTVFFVKQGDRYWMFNDRGDLILARLTSAKYEEIGRMHVLDPTNPVFGRQVVWSHPAFADRAVFVRNDRELVRVNAAAK